MDNQKKKIKKQNILVYFIGMCLLFFIINMFVGIIPSILGESVLYEKFGNEFIVEMFFALLVVVIMLMSKNHYVFTEKKKKFFKSIILGIPIIIIAIISGIVNIVEIKDFNFYHLINIFLYAFSVGIAEEFLCRGWLQNEFIERFGKNKKQVMLSIFLSSIIFGTMHFSNILFGQTMLETLLQVIQAIASGFLLGSIYYRTKNIWAVIFLHGFYDFCLMLSEVGVLKDCIINPNPSNAMVIFSFVSSLALILVYIFNSLIIMQKSKINDNFENEIITEEELKKEKKHSKIYIAIIVLIFIGLSLPIDIDGSDEYKTCFEFEKYEITYDEWMNSESHLPKYEDYTIKHVKENKNYTIVDGINTEVINNEEFEFKFYLDEDNDYLLTIENVKTSKKITLDYEYIFEFEILENPNNYIIVIHDFENNSIIYYSDFISKDNLSNSDDYLNKIKESFVEYDVPNLIQIGYMTTRKSNFKYPYFITEYENKMIIKEDKQLYLLDMLLGLEEETE